MTSRPEKVLMLPEFRARYGALYSDLKGSASALSILTFHNIRLFVLIPLLVFSSRHATFQAAIYLTSAVLSLSWDAALQPYDGRLLSCQVLVMDVAKVAAAVGYVLLAVPTISEAAAAKLCLYEVVLLVGSLTAGMILVVAQQVRDVARQVCRKKSEAYMVAGGSSGDSSTQIFQAQGTIS